MKIKGAKYEVMKAAIEAVIEHHGRDFIAEHFKTRSDTYTYWSLWNLAWFDLRNSDTHPAYVNGRVRIVPHNPDFDVYGDGVHDDHIETALKKICNEAGLSFLHRLCRV